MGSNGGRYRLHWKQWLGAWISTLPMATAGTLEILVVVAEYNLHHLDGVTAGLANWAILFAVFGCVIGAIFGAGFADVYGRKAALFSTTICAIGGIINASSTSSSSYCTTLLIGGLNAGIACVVVPLYISEIADEKNRGKLLMLQLLSIYVGQFLLMTIGLLVGIEMLNVMLILLPLVFLVTFSWFPETPYHLASKKHYQAAAKSLSFFRGIDELLAREEVENIVIDLREANGYRQRWCQKLWELLRENSRKALVIMTFLIIAQWNRSYFNVRYDLGDALQNLISISDNNARIIISALQLVWSALLVLTIDSVGRRLYLLGSLSVSLVIVITRVVVIMDRSYILFVTKFVLHLCHIVIYGVLFVFVGELFPKNLNGIASATIVIFGTVTKCLVFGITYAAEELVDHDWFVFIPIYSLTFLLVLAFVPETKNKSFLDIQNALADNKLMCLK